MGAKATLEGFNPCMVVELSATPPKSANVLVDVSGRELLEEEMIKLDLHIRNSNSVDWKHTLLAAIEHRKRLEEDARQYEASSGTYIRPICVIQVERTGRDQRGAGLIHAEDAREYLLTYPGVRPEHIAVKTSQRDELKDADEAGGPAVSRLPHPVHHYEAGSSGRVGLCLRVCAGHPLEPQFPNCVDAACRSHSAPAISEKDTGARAGRELRILLPAARSGLAERGPEGIRARRSCPVLRAG